MSLQAIKDEVRIIWWTVIVLFILCLTSIFTTLFVTFTLVNRIDNFEKGRTQVRVRSNNDRY